VARNSTTHDIVIEIAPVNDAPSFELAVSEVNANEGNGSAADTHRIHDLLGRVTAGTQIKLASRIARFTHESRRDLSFVVV